jgi:hypothetical protein
MTFDAVNDFNNECPREFMRRDITGNDTEPARRDVAVFVPARFPPLTIGAEYGGNGLPSVRRPG